MLESLEQRELLNSRLTLKGGPINNQDLRHYIIQKVVNQVPVSDRRLSYTTPEGTHVTVTLYGIGSLAGTTIRPDGSLDLVYNKTNAFSGIVGKVSGGTGQATLNTLRDGAVPILDLSGVNADPLGPVNLKDFNLVDGGNINLTGGATRLILGSIGQNTQIHLKSIANPGAPPGGGGLVGAGIVSPASNGTVTVNSNPFLDASNNPPSSSFGTSTGSASTTTTTTSSTSNPSGLPFINTGGASPVTTATGINIQVKNINGASRSSAALGDPQIFGYDPVANALVRFDATTGASLQTIPLTGLGTAISGAAMARDQGRLVVIVGDGTTIQAFDAVTGNPMGSFTTTNLASLGFNTIDGLGSTDFRTVLTDASAGANGQAIVISVGQSLAAGHAVPLGPAFAPQREFELSGGATGVAGTETVYLTGAAHFDSFQPNLTQFGIMALSTGNNNLTELSRTAVTSPKSIVNTGPPGSAKGNPINALGSVDQTLALITDSQNDVTFYNPKTLAVVGTVHLADPNRLTGLTESFHPELVNTALIDVQGDVANFRGLAATGLVLNVSGGINLVQLNSAADSTIIGHPVAHLDIPVRNDNVNIYSTTRINTTFHNVPLYNRGGVTVVNPNLPVMGPLSLP